jgi:hypothetical protein
MTIPPPRQLSPTQQAPRPANQAHHLPLLSHPHLPQKHHQSVRPFKSPLRPSLPHPNPTNIHNPQKSRKQLPPLVQQQQHHHTPLISPQSHLHHHLYHLKSHNPQHPAPQRSAPERQSASASVWGSPSSSSCRVSCRLYIIGGMSPTGWAHMYLWWRMRV